MCTLRVPNMKFSEAQQAIREYWAKSKKDDSIRHQLVQAYLDELDGIFKDRKSTMDKIDTTQENWPALKYSYWEEYENRLARCHSFHGELLRQHDLGM